jgi:DNA-binding MarR family transcriptional regulator
MGSMKSYRLVHQLLDLVEQFEAENVSPDGTLQDFAGFLVNHLQHPANGSASSEVRFGDEEPQAQEIAFQVDNNISRLVIFMNRYAKAYIRKALEGTPLQTTEDFTALAILLTHQDLSKSELIGMNIQEKTSGTVVIRRLIGAGLVKQWDDANDKRGKRISITDEGKKLLYEVFNITNNVGKMVTGKLTFAEKLTLQYLLQKLEDFHYPIFENKSVGSKDDLALWANSLSGNSRSDQ